MNGELLDTKFVLHFMMGFNVPQTIPHCRPPALILDGLTRQLENSDHRQVTQIIINRRAVFIARLHRSRPLHLRISLGIPARKSLRLGIRPLAMPSRTIAMMRGEPRVSRNAGRLTLKVRSGSVRAWKSALQTPGHCPGGQECDFLSAALIGCGCELLRPAPSAFLHFWRLHAVILRRLEWLSQ